MNLEEQISAVLNDPEAIGKITSMLGALGGTQPPQSPPPQNAAPQGSVAAQPTPQSPQGGAAPTSPVNALQGLQNLNLPDLGGDNRTRLLMAIKPFLSDKRAPYVDGAIALLRMMQLGKLGRDIKLF